MNLEYEENGYFVVKKLFEKAELQKLSEVLLEFHESWKRGNREAYQDKAVNSAYITGTEHLDGPKRELLFKFISAAKLMNVVHGVIPSQPCFMNTQLFFDPANENQKNYWHRDTQYHMSLEEQQAALAGPNVVHFRVPVVDEPGVELVPGTHKRWDSAEELDVRLERNGREKHEDLTSGAHVPLNAGDLLVFSANMIHRGVYGMNRCSFDVLFCDPEPGIVGFISDDCLPGQEVLDGLEDASAFSNTISLKSN